MAFTPLAVTTTLSSFRSQVRSASGALLPETIHDLVLNDIVHQAIVLVRGIAGPSLDSFYGTVVKSGTVAAILETAGVIDISSLDVAELSGVRAIDSVDGEMPIVGSTLWYGLQSLYSSTQLTEAIFGHVRTLSNGALAIELYRGSLKPKDLGDDFGGLPSTTTVLYRRNPTRATSDSTKIDLPENFMGIAIDVATVGVFRQIKQVPPSELENRVRTFVGAKIVAERGGQ